MWVNLCHPKAVGKGVGLSGCRPSNWFMRTLDLQVRLRDMAEEQRAEKKRT